MVNWYWSKICSFRNFKTVFSFLIWFLKFIFIFRCFVIRIMNSEKFFVRFLVFITQSTTFTPFFTPCPAVSHFTSFEIGPEKEENWSWSLNISKADFMFLKKKCYHLRMLYTKNYDHKYLDLQHHCLIWFTQKRLLKQKWGVIQILDFLDVPFY